MGKNILVVDDSKTVRHITEKVLRLCVKDIEAIFEAGNGKEALNILESNRIDLIFLDINMPVMNGVDFMKEYSKNPEYQNIPVVVISTEGSKARKAELTELGVVSYLRKPVSPEEIRETVNLLWGGCEYE